MSQKQIVSMIASEEKITLITVLGEVLDMEVDGMYDTHAITEYLLDRLDGKTVVDIDLSKYMNMKLALETPEYEDQGVEITYKIDGKEVLGVFYPQKLNVQVATEDGPVEIPKIEKLARHMNRAAEENSPAVRNFLRRLSSVIQDRKHSVEDLMDFVEKSELPLTDDGLVIGYKRLSTNENGNFVDVHSKTVKQDVGSVVWMDIDAVDPDRNQSCSHGLHVGNLGYMRGFYGDTIAVVTVDPADFIAVPHNETLKCRVARYTIQGILGQGAYQKVSNSQSGDSELSDLISNLVVGNTATIKEHVKVGTKKVLERVAVEEEPEVERKSTKARSGKSLDTDEQPQQKTETKAKDTVQMAKQAKRATVQNLWDNAPENVTKVFDALIMGTESKTAIAANYSTSTRTIGRWQEKYDFEGYQLARQSKMTVAETAQAYYKQWKAGAIEFAELLSFKKARKKGWAALGFNKVQIKSIEKAASA